MTQAEQLLVEKLTHCLNALKIMKNVDSTLTVSYPGLNRIIREAEDNLKLNPETIPDWYIIS